MSLSVLLRGEARLFRVASAVIVIAVVDDAFVHPRPGRQPAIIPLATLAALAGTGLLIHLGPNRGEPRGEWSAHGLTN